MAGADDEDPLSGLEAEGGSEVMVVFLSAAVEATGSRPTPTFLLILTPLPVLVASAAAAESRLVVEGSRLCLFSAVFMGALKMLGDPNTLLPPLPVVK
jgi:hypothetical protein